LRENTKITVAPSSPSEEPSSLNRPETLRAALDCALRRFLKTRRVQGDSPHTLTSVNLALGDLFDFLLSIPGLMSLTDVTHEHLLGYRDHLLTRPKRPSCPQATASGLLSAGSVRSYLWAVRAFFRHLDENQEVLVDPAHSLNLPRLPKRLPRDVPTAGEVRRLLGAALSRNHFLALRNAAILELLYGTGLRNAELCALCRQDLDVSSRVLFVRKGKGGKDRVLPIGEKAARALSRYLQSRRALDDRRPLFTTRFDTPMKTRDVRGLVRRSVKRSGLKKRLSPHSLRHAFATHLLKGNADIRKIQVLLGHASLSTTEIYTRVDTSDLKRVLTRCHPREISPL